MWEVTAGCESCGMEGAWPRCRWVASGLEHAHTPNPARRLPWGLGGLAGYQDNASSHTPAHQAPLVWRAPEGPKGQAAVPVGGNGG